MPEAVSAEAVDLLARLSAKPGVQSTLILSRSSGAILRASGLVSSSSSAAAAGAIPESEDGVADVAPTSVVNGDGGAASFIGGGQEQQSGGKSGLQNAEHVARAVWRFMDAADGMVASLEEGGGARLLRMRMARNEIVIVPSDKFLLVVIHDTPPA